MSGACTEKRGTRAGYQRHYNASEPPCDPCRKACADYSAVYKARHGRRKAEQREPAVPAYVDASVRVPYAVLGALIVGAPAQVEELADAELGCGVVSKAINAAVHHGLDDVGAA